jgi:hypothetical protein
MPSKATDKTSMKARNTVRRQLRLGWLAAAAILAAVGPAGIPLAARAAKTATDSAVYHAVLGPSTDITLKFESAPSRGVRGTFRARHMELLCDDGSYRHLNLGPADIRFTSPREFSGQEYSFDSFTYDEMLYTVSGRVFDQGRKVRGALTAVRNRPDREEMTKPDCGTHGIAHWHGELAHQQRR